MDKQRRPLDDYFSAARAEEGISEEEARSIVLEGASGKRSGRTSSRRRGLYYAVLGAVALLLGVLLLEPDRTADRVAMPVTAGTTSPASVAVPRPDLSSDMMTATRPEMDQQQPMGEYRAMAINPRIRKALAGVAVASAAVATSLAQTTPSNSTAKEKPAVLRQAEREMAQLMSDYWQVKLNGYRNTIDAMLPAADLAELNKLRVQLGIMMAPTVDIEQRTAQREGVQPSNIDGDTVGEHGKMKVMIMADMEGTGDHIRDSAEAVTRFISAFQQVKDIAGRNRSGFDRLGETVLDDVDGFITMARDHFTRFIAENRDELQRSDEGRELLAGWAKADTMFAKLQSTESRSMMQMLYGEAIEPLVMLYNGVGVGDFFRQAGPVASVMPGWALEENSVLKSCAPNPASSSVAISYVLPEPSSHTRLRLFNAQGEEVANYDLGERPAGEGVVNVNVTALPPGTYLYHLTTSTGKGDAVFSKTLRVVR